MLHSLNMSFISWLYTTASSPKLNLVRPYDAMFCRSMFTITIMEWLSARLATVVCGVITAIA